MLNGSLVVCTAPARVTRGWCSHVLVDWLQTSAQLYEESFPECRIDNLAWGDKSGPWDRSVRAEQLVSPRSSRRRTFTHSSPPMCTYRLHVEQAKWVHRLQMLPADTVVDDAARCRFRCCYALDCRAMPRSPWFNVDRAWANCTPAHVQRMAS